MAILLRAHATTDTCSPCLHAYIFGACVFHSLPTSSHGSICRATSNHHCRKRKEKYVTASNQMQTTHLFSIAALALFIAWLIFVQCPWLDRMGFLTLTQSGNDASHSSTEVHTNVFLLSIRSSSTIYFQHQRILNLVRSSSPPPPKRNHIFMCTFYSKTHSNANYSMREGRKQKSKKENVETDSEKVIIFYSSWHAITLS